MSNKILFICHESSRTGAPIFLLSFIKWIKVNTKSEFLILIKKGGELDSFFEETGPTLVLFPKHYSSIFQKLFSKFFTELYLKLKLKKWIKEKPALIYSNTISNGDILSVLKNLYGTKIITHVHELENVIESLGKRNLINIRKSTNLFFAASMAVRNTLIGKYGIASEKVLLQYEFIEQPKINFENKLPYQHLEKYKKGEFIVGGGGFVHERKGFDLFIETAKMVCINKGYKEISFIWIGEFGRGKRIIVEKLITENSLTENVHFLGSTNDPYNHFNKFNLFYLTSREDPFPLIMLENAYFGNPIICYKQGGGAPEFVRNDAGIIIDDFDVKKASSSIISLYENNEKLKNLGAKAKERLLQNHLLENNAYNLYMQISKFLNT